MADLDVYMIAENMFQIDCAEGSFVYGPSRFGAGRTELLAVYPQEAKSLAKDALISALVYSVY